MQKRQNHYALRVDLVEQPIAEHEQFANRGIVELGYDPTARRQGDQAARSTQCRVKNVQSARFGVLRNLSDDVVERLLSRGGPGYRALPSVHFRRKSAATCSWGMTRPAALSETPRSTA